MIYIITKNNYCLRPINVVTFLNFDDVFYGHLNNKKPKYTLVKGFIYSGQN